MSWSEVSNASVAPHAPQVLWWLAKWVTWGERVEAAAARAVECRGRKLSRDQQPGKGGRSQQQSIPRRVPCRLMTHHGLRQLEPLEPARALAGNLRGTRRLRRFTRRHDDPKNSTVKVHRSAAGARKGAKATPATQGPAARAAGGPPKIHARCDGKPASTPYCWPAAVLPTSPQPPDWLRRRQHPPSYPAKATPTPSICAASSPQAGPSSSARNVLAAICLVSTITDWAPLKPYPILVQSYAC